MKCLTIECCDFRKIRLTFVDFSQSAQPSISLTETLKLSFLIPDSDPKQGEFVPQPTENVVSSAQKFDVLSGNDNEDGDNWSLCEDDDVEEGEEITSGGVESSRSPPQVIKRKLMNSVLFQVHYHFLITLICFLVVLITNVAA